MRLAAAVSSRLLLVCSAQAWPALGAIALPCAPAHVTAARARVIAARARLPQAAHMAKGETGDISDLADAIKAMPQASRPSTAARAPAARAAAGPCRPRSVRGS
jgi:hypothetical protein